MFGVIWSPHKPLSAPSRIKRARAHYEGDSEWNASPLPLSEMGSNPTYPASRLNCDGEPVLYCAEAERTAVAEVRPGKGYLCTTCELALTDDIRVLDLAAPIQDLNPFTCSELSWKLDVQRIGRNLGPLIAQPMSRGEDKLLYGRTQLVGLVVRAMGLKGVRFSSSLDSPLGLTLPSLTRRWLAFSLLASSK